MGLFFIPFIIITSFAVLNFFIGIIIDSMQIAQKDDQSYKEHENSHITMKEYKLLKNNSMNWSEINLLETN